MKRCTSQASTQRTAYRVERGACSLCQFRELCISSGQDRTISRLFHQKLVNEAKERLSEPVGQELLKQRKVKAEGASDLPRRCRGLGKLDSLVDGKCRYSSA